MHKNIMKYLSLLLLAVTLMSAGCGFWETTRDYAVDSYSATKDFVDPPPQIDTDNYQFDNPNQAKLANLLAPVDGPLSQLARFIDDTDTMPGIDWLDLLLTRFPWVNRVIVTDEEGTIIFMQPEIPLKRITKPLRFEGVWRNLRFLTVVDYTDLGPELYIGRPYFEDVDFRGLIGVGFDPRMLLSFSPEPKELIIIHPNQGVWSRGADVDKDALLAVPWDEILVESVQGQVKVGDKYYTYLVKYIEQDPYIYATESVDPNADAESWWEF